MEIFLRTIIERIPFFKYPHAYLKIKSTEVIPHDEINTVERSKHYKVYTLAAFLDIERAFNSVSQNRIGGVCYAQNSVKTIMNHDNPNWKIASLPEP